MKRILNIGDNLMEEKIHGNYGFPFRIGYEVLSLYDHGRFGCHWHPEIEFTVILDGAMEYQVNDIVFPLTKGCGIFVNTNNLHTARSYDNQDCTYLAITLNPVLIFGHENSTIEKNYVNTITTSTNLSSLYLGLECEWQKQIIDFLLEIYTLYEEQKNCYELLIKSRLCELWAVLYQKSQSLIQNKNNAAFKDILRLKQTLSYIHNNYQEKLTLENIAASSNISKSECCHFFKKVMRQTPFEYLMGYRIRKSLPLLLEDTLNITEIADGVGFSNASYYSEIFRRYMYCSPTEYKKIYL